MRTDLPEMAVDLERASISAEHVLGRLDGASIFLTGGTGFIGCWLLEMLRHAVVTRKLDIHVTILSRNPSKFTNLMPHLAKFQNFRFVAGSIQDFKFPRDHFSHIIHGAADASAAINEHAPLQMYSTIVDGTRRVLEFASLNMGANMLFLSSGAVYGQQPSEIEFLGESYNGGPDPTVPRNAYAEAKRAAEMLCAIFHRTFALPVCIARIFTVIGPYMALGTHFAVGNFILQAMHGRPVVVRSNGHAIRSYLYAGDLVVCLLHLLVGGTAGRAYNVGSEEAVSVSELAHRVSCVLGDGRYKLLGEEDTGWNPGRYVPSTARFRKEFCAYQTVGLDQAILRTAFWNGWKGLDK